MHIPRLATVLPHFTQRLGALAKYVDFDEVALTGPVASIEVEVRIISLASVHMRMLIGDGHPLL